ncbi:unnamed protein product [Moneuplotes crassus]|uniref:Uncharacterized protein n=1 Tax=Euplotes crassus TaxID=5936 RepID=A0AAD1Y8Y0_EUPCR|nr:unnamed protein product [Moneuplotes crassus]
MNSISREASLQEDRELAKPFSNKMVPNYDEMFEENLSEEFLSEKVIPSSIKTSLGLIKNMSHTPFKSSMNQTSLIPSPEGKKLCKKENKFFEKDLRNDVEVSDGAFKAISEPKCLNKGRKFISQHYDTKSLLTNCESALMKDIHLLLKKAVKIRLESNRKVSEGKDGSDHVYEPKEGLKNEKTPRRAQSVTMRDIAQPNQ